MSAPPTSSREPAARFGSTTSMRGAVDHAASPSLGSAPPILFSDRGCPFAHRVLALLAHLGCPPDLRESMVGDKPEGVDAYSASGRIPLLVHGDLALTESRVMLEHLAEHFDFADAYPADLATRSLHRHAMAVVDATLAPSLGREHPDAPDPALEDALNFLERATATVPPRPCLLAVHVAPIWMRFRLWHPGSSVTGAVEGRAELCAWLDAAAQLECLVRTAPDPATHLADLSRARLTGLLPP